MQSNFFVYKQKISFENAAFSGPVSVANLHNYSLAILFDNTVGEKCFFSSKTRRNQQCYVALILLVLPVLSKEQGYVCFAKI